MNQHTQLKGSDKQFDPELTLPPAVRRAAEAADALQRRATGQPELHAEPQPDANDPNATIDIIQPPQPTPPPHVTTRVGNEPLPPAEPAEPPVQTTDNNTADDHDDPDQSWEHRYKSMRGQFFRLKKTVGEQTDRIHSLEALIETMSTASPAAPSDAPRLPSMSNLVTPEEREQFGDEMLDVIGRRAMEAAQPVIDTLQAQIASLKSQQTTTTVTVHRSEREKMLAALSGEVPDWRVVNQDDEFLGWLALPNPYTGVTRMKELQAAFEQNDASRVAAFFKGFKSEQAATAPKTQLPTPPVNTGAPAPQPDRIRLEDLAAPGRARSTGAQAPDDKPIITNGQIKEFYAQVRRGEYRGKEEEQARYEQMIFSAQRDGRIR